VPRTESLRKKE